jgi:cytoskeletal protein CcmA (bactofilin family)
MNELQGNQPTSDRPSGWSAAAAGTVAGSPGAGADHSLIGPTVVIRGEVSAEEDLMIMGRVEGFVDHSATVTIHAQGTVAAEVKAREVLVEGTVDGNVYGTERVEIAETGNVNGNVYAPRVGVLEGASFKGAIDMDADADAIERRFREKTGKPQSAPRNAQDAGPAKQEQAESAKGQPAGNAQANTASDKPGETAAASNETKGEKNAAQAQAGERDGASTADPKKGH